MVDFVISIHLLMYISDAGSSKFLRLMVVVAIESAVPDRCINLLISTEEANTGE